MMYVGPFYRRGGRLGALTLRGIQVPSTVAALPHPFPPSQVRQGMGGVYLVPESADRASGNSFRLFAARIWPNMQTNMDTRSPRMQ